MVTLRKTIRWLDIRRLSEAGSSSMGRETGVGASSAAHMQMGTEASADVEYGDMFQVRSTLITGVRRIFERRDTFGSEESSSAG